ncbi:hypothetical protein GF362_02025 [Candidatus Dojkabacteria bacterium]|nr:hypothetical protein [Candidatus Dojkabacteria bacterium]
MNLNQFQKVKNLANQTLPNLKVEYFEQRLQNNNWVDSSEKREMEAYEAISKLRHYLRSGNTNKKIKFSKGSQQILFDFESNKMLQVNMRLNGIIVKDSFKFKYEKINEVEDLFKYFLNHIETKKTNYISFVLTKLNKIISKFVVLFFFFIFFSNYTRGFVPYFEIFNSRFFSPILIFVVFGLAIIIRGITAIIEKEAPQKHGEYLQGNAAILQGLLMIIFGTIFCLIGIFVYTTQAFPNLFARIIKNLPFS